MLAGRMLICACVVFLSAFLNHIFALKLEKQGASVEVQGQELQESMEQPGRFFAHSGRLAAKCSRSGCSS